jgi:hypothetical protein
MNTVDDVVEVIKEEYLMYGVPVDTILLNEAMKEEFADLVNARIDERIQYRIPHLMSDLLLLRKKGQDKGGLPRLKNYRRGTR